MNPRASAIVNDDNFARLLGVELVELELDRVVVKLPYRESLGIGRIHGGAISGLVDIAATACFWSHPQAGESSQGATVGFTVSFLRLAVGQDLYATASIRRRGGTLSTGDVSVANASGLEVAYATVTYKLSLQAP
jgi:uncharacterized protein (TIGR00369 family)